jgi:hypothetical protein
MRAARIRRWFVLGSMLALWGAAPASAQDDEAEDETEEETSESGEGESEGESEEGEPEEGATEAEGPDAAKPLTGAPREWFFGPYFRYQFVPAFMLGLFLDEAPTVGNVAIGAAANYRPDPEGAKFEIGIGYAAYGFDDPFRISGDPREDTEWLDSSLGMIHLTGSILWDTELVENLTFEYGIGLDFGIVTGEIVRNEAYYQSNANQWAACQAPGVPDASFFYCERPNFGASDAYDEDGAHYDVVEERVPPIAAVPMLPHLALRYAFVPEVAAKFEVAYGIFQISLGLSVAYAPDI